MQLSRFNSSVKGFCTCPPKYNLNTYLGCCGHECIYCYATKFPTFNGPPIPRVVLVEQIVAMAKNTKLKLPVMISDCTDPYQPLEREHQITRKCIKALVDHGFPLLIVTKSDMVTRDVDLFGKTSTAVSITITTINEDIAKRIEPNAPAPEKRISALQKVIASGIPATVRIDPIIPYVNDDPDEFERLVSTLADVGIRQVTISTVKPVRGFFTKIEQALPEKHEKIVKEYEDAEWLMGYKYLAAEKRKAIVNKLRPIVLKHGLDFAACREGFPELNTTTCDGTAHCQTITTLTKYIK
ncbi:MAG TPA: radical SAM protein [Acidobacteriota bacterium]|nr:radical SAM protein [Acidobacteriota bacterium]